MFLLLNAVSNLFVSLMSRRADKPLSTLEWRAKVAHERLKGLGEPKTAMDAVKYMEYKKAADEADSAYLAAAEKADKWSGRKETSSRFVPAYLSGKLDAIAAAAVVYPYVPQVMTWVRGITG